MTESASSSAPPAAANAAPASTSIAAAIAPGVAPTLRRRLLGMVYESLLLFGVLFLAGYLFSALTQQHSGLMYRHAMQAWLFVVLGAYFVWFWTHGGQTLAMKTWKIRLLDTRGAIPGPARATLRYVLAWLWILPAMALDWALGLTGWASVGLLAAWFVAWAATALITPGRQFLHDRLAGTRLVDVPHGANSVDGADGTVPRA